MFQTLLQEEENQVRGFTYVFDCSGLTLAHLSIWTPQECSKVLSICEKNLPMRHKDINLLNLPFPMWAVFEFCKTLLSDKIRKRFTVLSNIEKLKNKLGIGKNHFLRLLHGQYGRYSLETLFCMLILRTNQNSALSFVGAKVLILAIPCLVSMCKPDRTWLLRVVVYTVKISLILLIHNIATCSIIDPAWRF